MDPISMEKIRAMRKYRRSRRQQQQHQHLVLPTLTHYMVAIFVLCLLLTSPVWLPSLCSLLSSFFITTLPGLVTALLLSPKCLFIIGNLIVAFLVRESRLAPRNWPASVVDVNDIHEEHVKKNAAAMSAKVTVTSEVVSDHSALVGVVGKEGEEEGGEEELEKRVEDFIARVKKQRKLEAKSFFDTDR